jgi:hypothetical protein
MIRPIFLDSYSEPYSRIIGFDSSIEVFDRDLKVVRMSSGLIERKEEVMADMKRDMASDMKPLPSEVGVASRSRSVIRQYKEGAVITREEAGEDMIEVTVPPKDVPLAEVGVSSSMTLNMGNYESVKVGISISLPTVLPELEEAYKAAKNLVDSKLNAEVNDIREYRKKRGVE